MAAAPRPAALFCRHRCGQTNACPEYPGRADDAAPIIDRLPQCHTVESRPRAKRKRALGLSTVFEDRWASLRFLERQLSQASRQDTAAFGPKPFWMSAYGDDVQWYATCEELTISMTRDWTGNTDAPRPLAMRAFGGSEALSALLCAQTDCVATEWSDSRLAGLKVRM